MKDEILLYLEIGLFTIEAVLIYALYILYKGVKKSYDAIIHTYNYR